MNAPKTVDIQHREFGAAPREQQDPRISEDLRYISFRSRFRSPNQGHGVLRPYFRITALTWPQTSTELIFE
jgi:hypothetical protein